MTEALAQSVLQMGMTNYQSLRRTYAVTRYAFYKLRTFPLRTLYRRYASQLRKFYYAFYTSVVTQYTWRRFRPMWSDMVISRTVFIHNPFSTDITEIFFFI